MGISLFFFVAWFFVFAVVEHAWVSVLPFPFSSFPLVFLCVIYWVQSVGVRQVAWWLVAQGILLDFWKVGWTSTETVWFSFSAVALVILSRRFFSNHSLYGLLGCGLFSLAILDGSRLISLLLWNGMESLDGRTWLAVIGWRVGWMVGGLFLAFLVSERLRRPLSRFFHLWH
ncbi:MAG TPA: hypothetical protein VJB99_00550 [Patescibacteria group bacterium]|nr:hypothetical protein [Patescibacteria group bacterium]